MVINVLLDWVRGQVDARRIPPPKFQHTEQAGRLWQQVGVTSDGHPVFCDTNYGKRGYTNINERWWGFRLEDIL